MNLGNPPQDLKNASHRGLLKAGGNEVEIFEFQIAGQSYGVNVEKVNQLIQRNQLKITRADLPPEGVIGSLTYRGKPIAAIDLRRILKIDGAPVDPDRELMLVTQFNGQSIAFAVDGAERIHRVSWEQFEPVATQAGNANSFINGIVKIEEKLVLMLDLEFILTEINPQFATSVDPEQIKRIEQAYKPFSELKILIAEDSAMIRRLLSEQLQKAGITQLTTANDGRSALDLVSQALSSSMETGRPFTEYYDLVLTDIEMPIMDGLTFCKQIKSELKIDVPVIVFSSLINDQMIERCKAVGADDWGAKPRIEIVVDMIERLVSKRVLVNQS